jgi:hypothetical protein
MAKKVTPPQVKYKYNPVERPDNTALEEAFNYLLDRFFKEYLTKL